MNKKSNRMVVIGCLLACVLIAFVPLFVLKDASFSGSDDAGSDVVTEVSGGEYTPWFEPVLETIIGGELPGEVESLLFCVQTGIGVGVLAFFMGRYVERKKWLDKQEREQEN